MIIDGRALAEQIKESIKKKAAHLSVRPGFAAVLIGQDAASHLYVDLKGRVAEELGFAFRKVYFPSSVERHEIISALEELSNDSSIHGIIVQLPLPATFAYDEIVSHIDPRKDIDCLHPLNLSNLFLGKSSMVPPTPHAVLRLIQTVERKISGLHIAVVGDGFFARQIAAHLSNNEAIVTLTQSTAEDLKDILLKADVIVSAIGKQGCITKDMVSANAILIDVGITKVKEKVMGDFDFESLEKYVRALTPVPGGVGPVTVALLMENVLEAAQHNIDATG
jgi:methylenetetrahydrofolate dehydrogenase (NADP+) / methenyltetrahydrofolate cyclohydrolase